MAVGVAMGVATFAAAQEKPAAEPKVEAPKPAATPDKAALFKQFEKSMSNVKLVGRFTMFGKEDKEAVKEEYTISKVTKLPSGDLWLFNARIKYGTRDITLPLPIEVKWAGDTPVITLTDFTIPAMGTFSARVVIYRDTYAGWWQHGEVGGHMFGKVEPVKEEKPAEKPAEKVEKKKE
jgi:hypothetical protein